MLLYSPFDVVAKRLVKSYSFVFVIAQFTGTYFHQQRLSEHGVLFLAIRKRNFFVWIDLCSAFCTFGRLTDWVVLVPTQDEVYKCRGSYCCNCLHCLITLSHSVFLKLSVWSVQYAIHFTKLILILLQNYRIFEKRVSKWPYARRRSSTAQTLAFCIVKRSVCVSRRLIITKLDFNRNIQHGVIHDNCKKKKSTTINRNRKYATALVPHTHTHGMRKMC